MTKIDPVPGSGATFALPPIRRAIVIERLERDTNDEVVADPTQWPTPGP